MDNIKEMISICKQMYKISGSNLDKLNTCKNINDINKFLETYYSKEVEELRKKLDASNTRAS